MTIKTRNWILTAGFFYNLLLAVVLAVLLSKLLFDLPSLSIREITAAFGYEAIATVRGLIFSLTALVIISLVFTNFRRTASAEVFFFFIFVITYPQEGILRLIYAVSNMNVPVYYITLGYRLFFFMQFMGVFSLFAAGLFSHTVQYTKLEISVGIILLAAFTLSAFIPIDSTVSNIHLFYFKEIWYLLIGVKVLSVLNLFFASFKQSSADYIWCGIAVIACIVSRDLQYYAQSVAHFILLYVLYIGGAWLYLNRVHCIYRWL